MLYKNICQKVTNVDFRNLRLVRSLYWVGFSQILNWETELATVND